MQKGKLLENLLFVLLSLYESLLYKKLKSCYKHFELL